MYEEDRPNEIRLLEIYENEDAYQKHLNTPHFQHYKNATMPMVKSLELIDMVAIDEPMMQHIFKKM